MKTPAFIHSPSSVGFTDTARVAGCDTTGSTPGRVPSTIPKRAEQGKESVGRTFVAGKGEGGQEERADRLQPRGRKASLLFILPALATNGSYPTRAPRTARRARFLRRRACWRQPSAVFRAGRPPRSA